MTRPDRDTRALLYQQESDKIHVNLVTITHPDLDAPIRVATGNADLLSDDPEMFGTISKGAAYQYIAMSLKLPDARQRSLPIGSMTIANGTGVIAHLRSFVAPPAIVDIATVFADAPDVEFQRWEGFTLREFTSDFQSVTFDLRYDQLFNEPYGLIMSYPRLPSIHY